jgi:predicted AAA+ superfamily ATPase
MKIYARTLAATFREKIERPWVHILFGARQTGKSTLIRQALPDDAYVFNLADPAERASFSAHPEELIRICRSMPRRSEPWVVFIDEAQTVPEIFNAVQLLFDEDHESRRFILCGSSARKLRTSGANLLPGRSIQYSLFPLTTPEYRPIAIDGLPVSSLLSQGSLIPSLQAAQVEISQRPDQEVFPFRALEDRLLFGELPAIATIESPSERRDLLKTYVTAHLEEEIRRETALRDWGVFLRFLLLASTESGGLLNLKAISRESGLSAPTIRSHYQLLEDMFLGFMLPAFSGSPRKSVLSSPRFFFFDLGVRNAAAGLAFTEDSLRANPGPLFEQWVGIELYKRLRYLGEGSLCYYRTSGGAEVDFIVERGGRLSPIEVKWTERPTLSDARHLISFMKDQSDKADHGYIVCRCKYPQSLSENITAIPWWGL